MFVRITKLCLISIAVSLLSLPMASLLWAETPVETELTQLLFNNQYSNGMSYAVDVDGDTAVVGGAYSSHEGAQVFIRSNGAWIQQAELTPSEGWENTYAAAVAISGDTIVLGSAGWFGYRKSTKMYIFVRTNGVWIEQARILAPLEQSYAQSPSVAIDGDTVVMGFVSNPVTHDEVTLVYHRANGIWSQQAEFLRPNTNSVFGGVAISGDTLAFKSGAHIEIHKRNGDIWEPQELIQHSNFGYTNLALFQDTLVFGDTSSNSAYVYRRGVNEAWNLESQLIPSGETYHSFGFTTDIYNNNIVVGYFGGGYLFTRNGSAWNETKKLISSSAYPYYFGWSVAISSDTIVIGGMDHAAHVYGYQSMSSDQDNDGILDVSDNCPTIINPDQWDSDLDGIGDYCDDDNDNDGIKDNFDNCRYSPNPDQLDADGDGSGDVCDIDLDGDTVYNNSDNCLNHPNPGQEDNDLDSIGDACDLDDDNDGIADAVPDNCPFTPNPNQNDLDNDGVGDLCDIDKDGDGVNNGTDNCPLNSNPGQDDTDQDSYGDACDEDDDADFILDINDNCPLIHNPDQYDTDYDGQGDACDGDLDGDGVANEEDNCPVIPNGNQNDFDADGVGDSCDPDIDGDAVTNDVDQCPATPIDEIVDPDTGCAIAQLCPCSGPRGSTEIWRNHGKYVSCTTQTAKSFVSRGLISDSNQGAIVAIAAESDCGH
ncbi:thrombospondin type 3 repeat-containing protein [Pseudomonadota bacterium]